MVNLTTLAPDIVAAILVPNHVTLFELAVDLPALLDEQRARLRKAYGDHAQRERDASASGVVASG